MSDFEPVRNACALVGSIAELARQLKLPPQAVHNWATGKQAVPIVRCVQIEEITGGQVTRKQLRPDDWWAIWPELRGVD